jgi:hypothetical protein
MPPKKSSGGRRGGKKAGALPKTANARKGSAAGGRASKRGKNKS